MQEKNPVQPPSSRRPGKSSMRSYILSPSDFLPRRWRTWLACGLCASLMMLLVFVAIAFYLAKPAQAGAAPLTDEALYLACVREARLQAMPVKPLPRAHRNVQDVREGKLLLRRTEILDVDVGDMSPDNGCQASVHHLLRQDALPGEGRIAPINAATDCRPLRDMSMQSHYLMLSLCTAGNAPPAATAPTPIRKRDRRNKPST